MLHPISTILIADCSTDYGIETTGNESKRCNQIGVDSIVNFSTLSSLLYTSASSRNPELEATVVFSPRYWTLILTIIPALTLFGNSLVCLSVWRETSLRSATNYFIVSLAVADIMVALLVMPPAVYVEVNNAVWLFGDVLCDVWVACDVMCCTASILNLTAICIDRFIAVTRPISYAKHRSGNVFRVRATVAAAWLISISISSPIVLGANYTEQRLKSPSLCTFYNAEFIIYSSIGSFYAPCVAMLILYWKIFRVINDRMRRSTASDSQQTSIYLDRTGASGANGRPRRLLSIDGGRAVMLMQSNAELRGLGSHGVSDADDDVFAGNECNQFPTTSATVADKTCKSSTSCSGLQSSRRGDTAAAAKEENDTCRSFSDYDSPTATNVAPGSAGLVSSSSSSQRQFNFTSGVQTKAIATTGRADRRHSSLVAVVRQHLDVLAQPIGNRCRLALIRVRQAKRESVVEQHQAASTQPTDNLSKNAVRGEEQTQTKKQSLGGTLASSTDLPEVDNSDSLDVGLTPTPSDNNVSETDRNVEKRSRDSYAVTVNYDIRSMATVSEAKAIRQPPVTSAVASNSNTASSRRNRVHLLMSALDDGVETLQRLAGKVETRNSPTVAAVQSRMDEEQVELSTRRSNYHQATDGGDCDVFQKCQNESSFVVSEPTENKNTPGIASTCSFSTPADEDAAVNLSESRLFHAHVSKINGHISLTGISPPVADDVDDLATRVTTFVSSPCTRNVLLKPPSTSDRPTVNKNYTVGHVLSARGHRAQGDIGRDKRKKSIRQQRRSNRRERKVTKTLAIVLGVFLFCWFPFFTLNIINAVCIRYNAYDYGVCDVEPLLISSCVWLGYINSFLNPVIYTIFNAEFRRAFRRLLLPMQRRRKRYPVAATLTATGNKCSRAAPNQSYS